MSKPLLQYPGIRAPHLEGHYYVHIRRFLAKHNASLEIDCIPKPTYERKGDEYIMDIVCSPTTTTELNKMNLKHYTDAEIRQLYYCKSYLKVQRISDLCTADGVFVLPSIAKGERSIRQCTSKLEEIRQERPGGNTWTIWRKFLATLCTETNEDKTRKTTGDCSNNGDQRFSIGTTITKYWSRVAYKGTVIGNTGKYYKIRYEDNDEEELNHNEVKRYMEKNTGEGRMTREIGNRMRLRRPLGEWNILANESERMWPFYYSHESDTLYRSYRKEWHNNGEFYYDCHTMTDSDTYEYVTTGNVSLLPVDATPTDVMDTETGWRISTHLPMKMKEQEQQGIRDETFMEYLMKQEEHITQYYTEIDFLSVPIKIYQLLKTANKIHIATDGGAIPLKGSLGFVFADENGTILLTCFGQPAGNDPLSFRSEICAFLAAIRLVTLIMNYYDKKLTRNEPIQSKIQVYTDSLSMIKKLTAYDKYPTAPLTTLLDSEWDVLSALHRALQCFTRYPKINWVKSHQDDKEYDKTEMPLDAYLNSEADELATTGLKRLQEKPLIPMDPNTVIQFHIDGRTITRDFKRTVREMIQLKPLRQYYCARFEWSDNLFDVIDWDIFRPVYKKNISTTGIQWLHKYCMKKLPTGERINKRDHFHDKRCASCWHSVEDDDHIFRCVRRKGQRKNIFKQINVLRNNRVDKKLCDILQEGLLTYFKGECMTNTMLRIRGGKDMENYSLLIDEQLVIGRDNLLQGRFSKQWRIQQKAYTNRIRLKDPALHARKQRERIRKEKIYEDKHKGKKTKNKTEAFHSFFKSIVPIIKEIWTERCIDRNTPVIGGRIVAEYDSLTKEITQIYTLRGMVLPEDEVKIYDETLEIRLEDTNQQLKKWINRWKIVIDHSMKRVKEMAQERSKPIWQHYTATKPIKTRVSRKISTRKHKQYKKMYDNPMTNVFQRLPKKRSSSRVITNNKVRYKGTTLIEEMYKKLGKQRSTSRAKPALEVEGQIIEDRFGDAPA